MALSDIKSFLIKRTLCHLMFTIQILEKYLRDNGFQVPNIKKLAKTFIAENDYI